jgi:hypothetical protein
MAGPTSRPYRPSNSSEGEWFEAEWCDKCIRDGQEIGCDGCDILARGLAFGIGDPGFPTEWQIEGGKARCDGFHPIDPLAQPLDPAAVVRPLL